jgi:hypothetical protein
MAWWWIGKEQYCPFYRLSFNVEGGCERIGDRWIGIGFVMRERALNSSVALCDLGVIASEMLLWIGYGLPCV